MNSTIFYVSSMFIFSLKARFLVKKFILVACISFLWLLTLSCFLNFVYVRRFGNVNGHSKFIYLLVSTLIWAFSILFLFFIILEGREYWFLKLENIDFLFAYRFWNSLTILISILIFSLLFGVQFFIIF